MTDQEISEDMRQITKEGSKAINKKLEEILVKFNELGDYKKETDDLFEKKIDFLLMEVRQQYEKIGREIDDIIQYQKLEDDIERLWEVVSDIIRRIEKLEAKVYGGTRNA